VCVRACVCVCVWYVVLRVCIEYLCVCEYVRVRVQVCMYVRVLEMVHHVSYHYALLHVVERTREREHTDWSGCRACDYTRGR
jgi:hypothetical protein